MNEIAAKLGEVGLPEPVAELAKRDWDAIVAGSKNHSQTTSVRSAARGQRVCSIT